MFTKENQQILNIKRKKEKKKRDQIRSRSSPLDRDQCDGCSAGLYCGFGATVASVRAERSVREKVRWLGVGWERAGQERKRGGSGCWGWLGGSGQWREESTVRKRESRDWVETREGDARVFWKMVYGKIFCKPFSLFYAAIFRSIYVNFPLTLVLQRPKHPKMLKTFSVKRFTSKQTEPIKNH